ncbi:hypothetical protein [Pelagicoccus mobilis]|uniref:Uncharacterized protein n=1 Tax=Pelagicoccus mobilis TaxID=415221 RepID=A0A934S287_9BACT|nr:hypothetical protein [Pelagicoccus mobilis]MBK1878517.1 hypothetical protein [Pelagicoccus mobilis]
MAIIAVCDSVVRLSRYARMNFCLGCIFKQEEWAEISFVHVCSEGFALKANKDSKVGGVGSGFDRVPGLIGGMNQA